MKNLLRLIFMAGILLMFTQCGKDSEPEPKTVTEIWQLTYDDYHALLSSDNDECKNLTRKIKIVRNNDELTFIGLFSEYPDAFVKGTIKGDKVYIPDAQILQANGNDTLYLHWGHIDCTFGFGITFDGTDVSFRPGDVNQEAFTIFEDGSKMIAKMDLSNNAKGAFWINSNQDGYIHFYSHWSLNGNDNHGATTGTGFPDIPNMIRMELTKISDSN